MKVAIIGSGISGLAAAHRLRHHARVTLLESGSYFGGHTHTVDVTLDTPHGPRTWGVDTGFLVYNDRTYPQLVELFKELNVRTAESDMSFSVQVPAQPGQRAVEWSGSDLGTVFAQRGNLLRPRFLGMLADLLRFNRVCTRLARRDDPVALGQPLGAFLKDQRFGNAFRDWYLLPMLGCIWSCPTDQMLQFPLATMIRFCHNHGLLQINDRPQWRTVHGGARHYVEKIVATLDDARLQTPVFRIDRDDTAVTLHTSAGIERFDHVVVATHSNQALAMLRNPSIAEREILGAIRYQPNRAVLHTDASVLPRRRAAWAAWNYERAAESHCESARVCLHYLLNRLQPLPFEQPVIESLNPVRPIAPSSILAEFDYEHPIFDRRAIAAQQRIHELQGLQRTWYCGAWTGYGFHEDGLKSGLAAADDLISFTASARKAAA